MNRINTKALVEGAIFAAITVLIGLISFYIPFLFVISYFWAIPTIVISYRHGFRTSFVSGLSSALILAMFMGPATGLNTFLMTLLPGMFLGFFMKKFKKQQNLIMASMIITVICTVVAFAIGALIAGMNPLTMYNNTLTTFVDQYSAAIDAAKKTYAMVGMTPDQLASIPNPKDFLGLMKKVIVVLLMVGGVGVTIFNLWVTKKILHRMKIEIPGLEPISHWHLSLRGLLVVTILIGFVLVNMYFFKENTLLMDICMNISIALIYWFWFLGVATGVYFVDRLSLPKAIKVLIILITALPMMQIYALVGYVEAAFDFRKLRPEIVIKGKQ